VQLQLDTRLEKQFKMKKVFDIRDNGLDLSKKVYECSNCNVLFNWSKNSQWFGTWKEWDEGKIKTFACSEKCVLEIENTKGS